MNYEDPIVQIIIGLSLFIIGGVLTYFANKFINRVTKLKYSIWHNYIGYSLEDEKFGTVKLLYNDNQLKSLYSSGILIHNDTGMDLSNVELNISCDPDSLILVSYGKRENSVKELEFTNSYSNMYEAHNDDDIEQIYRRRDYLVPVINRGDKINITLLTTNTLSPSRNPVLNLSTAHVGVRLKYHSEPIKLFGVPQNTSAIIGIVIGALLTIFFCNVIDNFSLLAFLIFLNGAFASLYGVLFLKCYYWLINIYN